MTQPGQGSSGSLSRLPPPKVSDANATDPSLALADVWELLDALPAAEPSIDMMSSTLEMAAVPAGSAVAATGGTTSRIGSGTVTGNGATIIRGVKQPPARRWLVGAALVGASFLIGIVAGRATAPDPDLGILANLPIARHVDLLREAGSVAFLEEVAKRDYPPPRRPPRAQSQAGVRADAQEFDAAIEALRTLDPDGFRRESLAARREQVLKLSDQARRQLEQAVESYQRLSAADRRELAALGRALADPSHESLLQAARLWHMWIQFRDPADRRDVIELGTADRLEWLDRLTRLDGRNEGRMEPWDNGRPPFERDWENRRRPPPDFRRDDHPRPPGPPRPRGPGPGPGPGPGRGPGPDADRDGPSPGGRPFNGPGPQPPEETAAPPR